MNTFVTMMTAAVMFAACGGRFASDAAMPTAPTALPATPTVPANSGSTQTFLVRGTLREGGSAAFLIGARAVIASGPDAGQTATSGPGGIFTFESVQAGSFSIDVTKDGYQPIKGQPVSVSENTYLTMWLFATPPRDSRGVTATARCGDGTWSWATSRAIACTNNDGVEYPVCPGPLCTNDDRAGRAPL